MIAKKGVKKVVNAKGVDSKVSVEIFLPYPLPPEDNMEKHGS